MAGVYAKSTSDAASSVTVYVDKNGKLGSLMSSRRYKEDIRDMGDASQRLFELRPVTYHYKQLDADGSKPLEYGLIAEEVAQVYPDLVVHGKDGQIETVQYHKLVPMLLNEIQRLRATCRNCRRRRVPKSLLAKTVFKEVFVMHGALCALFANCWHHPSYISFASTQPFA